MSGDLFRLRNCSKLVERSLFAIIDLLQGAKSILLYLIGRVGGMIFIKNFKLKKFHSILFHLIFLCYNCSINLKRLSEHSGLHPDTSILVCHKWFATRSEIYLFEF